VSSRVGRHADVFFNRGKRAPAATQGKGSIANRFPRPGCGWWEEKKPPGEGIHLRGRRCPLHYPSTVVAPHILRPLSKAVKRNSPEIFRWGRYHERRWKAGVSPPPRPCRSPTRRHNPPGPEPWTDPAVS